MSSVGVGRGTRPPVGGRGRGGGRGGRGAKKQPRLFPSSLCANTNRVQSIFSKHYHEEPPPAPVPTRASQQQAQKQQPQTKNQAAAEEESPKENRRATRSTHKGMADEWLKIPMQATVKVLSGAMETLEGYVYLSLENGRLFKHHGKVYFEASWQGSGYKYYVPEGELPMITDEHPQFRSELHRIEEEKTKKLSKTKHMFKLHRENEQANFECERNAAERTCELRLEELKERMLERVEDELEDLHEELELRQYESVAIDRLNALDAKRANRMLERQREEDQARAQAAEDEAHTQAYEAAMSERIGTSSAYEPSSSGNDMLVDNPAMPVTIMESRAPPSPSMSSPSALAEPKTPPPPRPSSQEGGGHVMTVSSEERCAQGGVAGESTTTGEVDEGRPPHRKKRRRPLHAGDLAINVLSVASDIREGLQFVGLVDDSDYIDIEEVIIERMMPDADYDEDEDLLDLGVHV